MCNKHLLSTNTVFNSRISPFKIKSEIQGSKIYLLKSLYKSDEILLFFSQSQNFLHGNQVPFWDSLTICRQLRNNFKERTVGV